MTATSQNVPPVLAVAGLAHRFGEREVLASLSFDVSPGEIVGLLGPNGSGKSTALAIVAGLLGRQGGTITFRGRTLTHADRGFRGDVGVVFQAPSLDLKLSGRENLDLAGRIRGLGGAALSKRVDEQLTLADLTERADEPVGNLSGGMRRRLDIARALIDQPKLLLLDEPTSGLDEASFRRTWHYLKTLRSRGVGLLLATHRPDEAARCDRLVLMDGGRAIRSDSPDALVAELSDDLVAIEVDSPREAAAQLTEQLDLTARVAGSDRVVIECERGPEMVVRVIETLGRGKVRSIALTRPTLADVFVKLTGNRLDAELANETAREAA